MGEISLAAETIFSIGGFSVTNSMLVTALLSIGLIIFALVVRSRVTTSGKISDVQNLMESVFEGAFSLMDTVTGDRKQSKKFFALVMTLFIFVLCANWSGLLPGVGPIGVYHEAISEQGEAHAVLIPFFRAPSSDLNTTLALAIISFLSFQIFGIATIGFFKYGSKFINFRGPIDFFIGILELIGEVAKVISLSFRLFGNVFAGEVLLLVIAFLVPIIAPLPFFALEIFVGLIQAFIFSMLTLVFLRVATDHPHA